MLRKDIDDLYENGLVGDWVIADGKDGMHLWLRYPCKGNELCGDELHGGIVHLPIIEGESILWPVRWGWNGSKETPTLTPSILVNGGDGNGGHLEYWHGYLTDGKLVNA